MCESEPPGRGRKPLAETDPALLTALEGLVAPATRGHPESPLRWTCKSTWTLASELHLIGKKWPAYSRGAASGLAVTGD